MARPTTAHSGRPYSPLDERLQGRGDIAVIEHLEGATQQIGHALAGLRRIPFVGQPITETFTDVGTGQAFVQHLARQEVGLHELAERATDLVLAMRNDRGVRDGYAERMSEERRHGEPIGQRADHRRLGEGPEVDRPMHDAPAAPGDEEQDRHSDEKRRGDDLHLAECTAALKISHREDIHRSDATRSLSTSSPAAITRRTWAPILVWRCTCQRRLSPTLMCTRSRSSQRASPECPCRCPARRRSRTSASPYDDRPAITFAPRAPIPA